MHRHRPLSYPLMSVVGATQHNDVPVLKEVLDKKNMYAGDDLAKALHFAAEKGYSKCAELLLSHNALVDFPYRSTRTTPLMTAARNGHLDCVNTLLKFNSDAKKSDSVRATALHYAAVGGNLDCLKSLITAGCDVNGTTLHCRTPLILAAKNGHDLVVQKLSSRGALINDVDKNQMAALHHACLDNQPACVRVLLKLGARVNDCDIDGMSPLQHAARGGHMAVMRLLLCQLKIKIYESASIFSTMHMAVLGKNPDCVKLLLEYCVDYDLRTEKTCLGRNSTVIAKGVTPLMLACSSNFIQGVSLLIEAGANVDNVDEELHSPITKAIRQNNEECVKLLIQSGAELNGPTKFLKVLGTEYYGVYPVFLAINDRANQCLKVLIEANCDLNITACCIDEAKATPIEFALFLGNIVAIKMLLLASKIKIINTELFSQTHARLLVTHGDLALAIDRRLRNALTLMELCRIRIRDILGHRFINRIDEIPLPEFLLHFVKLKDLEEIMIK